MTNNTSYLLELTKDMREDLINCFKKNRKNIGHKGLKGSGAEFLLMMEFFEERYPFIKACGGEIVSANNYRSNQIDIILYDPLTTPVFYKNSKYVHVVPIEGVFATIEVKYRLTTENLRKIIYESSKLKSQTKSAYWNKLKRYQYNFYGKSFDHFPITTIAIAYDGISMETLGTVLKEEFATLPYDKRIDYIFILNRGLVYIDRQTNEIRAIFDLDYAMFMFYCLTYSYFSFANSLPIRLHDYAGDFLISTKKLVID